MRNLVRQLYIIPYKYKHNLWTEYYDVAGDGIISAIDLYVSLDEVKGVHDEDRLVVTFNGKWLQFNEHFSADNTAAIHK